MLIFPSLILHGNWKSFIKIGGWNFLAVELWSKEYYRMVIIFLHSLSIINTGSSAVCICCILTVYIYEGNSISKLQIQVATYVFELSVGNCHR